MNAKNSHCMSRKLFIAAVALFASLSLSAQRYYGVVGGNGWNSGINVCGIRQDTTVRAVSFAELNGHYIGGTFKSSSQPTSAWTVGATARTLVHLKQFSMIGAFSFEEFQGKGMAGSMFITPGCYPVDVIEFTPGRKSRQKYSFEGGISVDVAPQWRIGAKMDFLSANYAKRKDVRHTNYRLDMTIAPGVQWHSGDLAIGLNYVFNKNSESVKAEQIGTGESSYYAFLDKGNLYGTYEIWSGSGTHLSEPGVNGFPVSELAHGAAAQVSWKGFFAQVQYRHSNGKVGEKDFVWFRFPGNEVSFNLAYNCRRDYGSHAARLEGKWRRQTSFETVLEKVTSGGVTNVHEYGSNQVYDRATFSLRPAYSLSMKKVSLSASLLLNFQNELSSPMYPYMYRQKMFQVLAQVGVKVPVKGFTPGLDLYYGDGSFSNIDQYASFDSGVQTTPYKLEKYWAGQMEYLTTSKLVFHPYLVYTFKMGIFLGAEATVTRAFNLKVIPGNVRYDVSIKLGYSF